MPVWLASVSAGDWLAAGVNSLGILTAFVVGAIVGPWLNSKRARLEAKERVLRTLLTTRVNAVHPDFSASIAIIPLEFSKSKSVRSAHAKYLAATNRIYLNDSEKAAYTIEIENCLDDLISAIARDIGLDVTGHEGVKYISGAFVSRSQLQESSWNALIRVAASLERAETRAFRAPQQTTRNPPEPEEDGKGFEPTVVGN